VTVETQPYVGPRPFERADQALFFGRDREADELVSLVVAYGVVLLYAESGAGKSSLINARLIPLLEKEEGFEVLPVARVGGIISEKIDPKEIPNIYVFNTLVSWAKSADPAQLTQMSLVGFLKERPRRTDETGLPLPLLIVFDQFEELFSFYPDRWREREGFFKQVSAVLEEDRIARVVFAIREDYIAQLDPYAHLLPEKLRTRFRLQRLRKEAALSAIRGPLRGTGRSFAVGMAEKLVEELLKIRVETATSQTVEVAGEFVEPVQLQVICQSLWRNLPPEVAIIRRKHLQKFGDVDRALEGFYEEAIAAAAKTGVHQTELRQWFANHLITSTGTRGIVHRGLKSTQGVPNSALDILEGRHLIRSEWRAGARWYELTHDRFIGPIRASNERWHKWRHEKSETASAILRRAEQGIAERAYERALEYCQEALDVSREIGDTRGISIALSYMGNIYREQRDYVKALEIYQRSFKISMKINDSWTAAASLYYMGHTYRALNRNNEALHCYQQVLHIEMEIGDEQGVTAVLRTLGNISYEMGDYSFSTQCFTYYIERRPDDPDGYERRAAALWGMGKYEEALANCTLVIQLNPGSFWSYYQRAKLLYEADKFMEAIEDLNRAITLGDLQGDQTNVAEALCVRGVAYTRIGKYEEALKDITASIEADRNNARPYYIRARVYLTMGQHEQLIADLTAALEKDAPPLSPDERKEAEELLKAFSAQQ
jgi:tetratricopeptide (TPR) repeat protein